MSEYIDMTEAARILGVSEKTVYNQIRGGALRAYRFGRAVRIKITDLEAALTEVACA